MKGREFWGIMLGCAMLGGYCQTKTQPAIAEAPPMIRPIFITWFL